MMDNVFADTDDDIPDKRGKNVFGNHCATVLTKV